MTTNNSVAPVSATSTVISQDVAERIEKSFNDLVHLAGAYLGVSFPEGTKRDEKWEKAIHATFKAHARFRAAQKEAAVREFRAGCEKVVEAARKEKRAAKAEYDNLSPALKAMVGAFKTDIRIPVADFADVFNGLTTEQIVVKLGGKRGKGNHHDKGLGYNVVKSTDGEGWDVLIALEPKVESKEEKDARVGVIRREKTTDAAAE